MRIGVLSDIHGNLPALQAVLADLRRGGTTVDAIWCLGDVVGYGPEPNECVEEVRQGGWSCVAGNHDVISAGDGDTAAFNPAAAQALEWTRRQLTAENRDYLAALPHQLVVEGVTLAHGSPRDPVWEYVLSVRTAGDNFACFGTPMCLVGHTHVPAIFRQANGRATAFAIAPDHPLDVSPGRHIVNPGSIGQPRDGDARASYAILDTVQGVVVHRRVSYPVALTQEKMRVAGLPGRLADRLAYGW